MLRKKQNKSFEKIYTEKHVEFIKSVVDYKGKVEEKYWNLNVNTDGNIAQVYFDFIFHRDEEQTNRGQEGWQLVKTDKGWKIFQLYLR